MATDQEIRDAGLLYVPKQKYLQDPYNLSTPPPPPPPDGGITNTNAFTGSGGDNFSVYNPDPNSISNRDYNPRPYYDATYEDTFGTNLGDPEALTATGARFAEPNTKMSGILNMIPGAGIARFLGNQIGPYIPPNRRAIMENQLSGQGIMVNDIGQIVQGDGAYDDISGRNVMAGYNANKITAKTFDDRIAEATLKMNDDGPYKQKRLDALEAAKADFLAAQGKTKTIYDFEEEEKKKKKKDTVVGRFITKKKEAKATKDAQAAQAVELQKLKDAKAATYYTPDGTSGGGAGQGIDISNAGNIRSSDNNFQGDSGPTTQQESDYGYGSDFGFAKGGRAGYFFGGRVNYKTGGRINFRGGGMDMGNEENQKQSAEMGNTTVSNNNDSGNDNPPNFFVEDKTSVVDTSGLKSKSPEININYTDPKNYASLKSRVYNTNILDNDDLNVDGTLSGEIGPVSYNTNFTDQGITGTNLKAGKFNADIDANKNYSIGYANNYNGIDYGTTYDSNGNLMFNAGVKFKNGGLAGLL